jgi:hypothetical protein
MPVRVKTNDALLVTFMNGRGSGEQKIARTVEHALEIARRMLAECDELYPGDILSVSRWPRTKPYDPFSLRRRRPAAKPRSKRSVRRSDG